MSARRVVVDPHSNGVGRLNEVLTVGVIKRRREVDEEQHDGNCRVLVACHPYPFEGIANTDRGVRRPPHWQAPVIKSESALFCVGRSITYETIDVNEGGTYQASVLIPSTDNGWVRQNRGRYDVVWLPDCGGAWFQMFDLEDIAVELYMQELEYMVSSLLSLVKPGGRLYLGKVLNDRGVFVAQLRSLGVLLPGVDDIMTADFSLYGKNDLKYVVISKGEADVGQPARNIQKPGWCAQM